MNKIDIEVYNLLVNSEIYITAIEMSELIGCSEKTIRNSLDRIEKELDSLQIKYILERKQSKGIKLDVKENYDINENIDFLMLDLLKNKNNYLTDLQKKYYLSYNGIRNQITLISYKLKRYDIDLEIKQRQGIILECEKGKIKTYLKEFFIKRIDKNLDLLLEYYYPNVTINLVNRIVDEFEVEEEIILTNYSRNYLKILILTFEKNSESSNLKTNVWTEKLRRKIYLYLNIKLNQDEIVELKKFFESRNFLENVDFLELKNDKIDELIESLDEHFNQIGEKFLSKDKNLTSNLKNHLKLTLYKNKNNENSKNPIFNEIKEQYPYYFNEVFNVVEEFNSKNHNVISIVEVSFIVIYILTVEKSTKYKKSKAVIVCNFGNLLSKYLIEILRNNFEWIDFGKTIAVDELKNYNMKDYLIFSTIQLTGYDYIKIPKYIDKSYIDNIKIDVIKKKSNYIKLFSKDRFKIGIDIKSRDEVISRIVGNSYKLGLVEEEFLATVMYREKLDSTEIGKGLVLLHGDDEHVKESHISFFKLNNAIDWKDDKVKYIFLIAVKKFEYEKYDMRQFFKQLIKLKDEICKIEEIQSLEQMKILLSK